MTIVVILSYFGATFIGLLLFVAVLYLVTLNDKKMADKKDLMKKTPKTSTPDLDIIRPLQY
jgi:hypothetical protein